MTTAVQLAQSVAPGVSLGFKNRIINGAMMINQRNAGASISATDGAFVVDRFQSITTAGAKGTMQQNAGSVTPPAGFTSYIGFTSNSAYTVGSSDTIGIRHKIEGLNVADLGWGTNNAATVTLSFWVRSSLTGTFGGGLWNSAQTLSYPFSYTISAAGTWEYKTVTIAGPTSATWLTTNGVGIGIQFSLGAGSNMSGTPGAWTSGYKEGATGQVNVVATNGATFYITGVQLEVGTAATSFEFRDYGRELIMCQRYYELVYADSQAVMPLSYSFNASNHFNWYQYKVEKRASPTVNKLNGTWNGGSAVPYASVGSMTFFASSSFYLAGTSAGQKTFEIVSEL